jgi:hypothetical protein
LYRETTEGFYPVALKIPSSSIDCQVLLETR